MIFSLNQVLTVAQINDNLKTPMRIAAVRVEGASSTRTSFLDWLVKPHLERHVLSNKTSEGEDNSTVQSVLKTTRDITHTLRNTDIFALVEPRLEAARSYLAREGDVDLVFKTKPRGRYFLKTSTSVGDQEGSVVRTHSHLTRICCAYAPLRVSKHVPVTPSVVESP